jgi:hypothetical protein
MNRLFRHSNRHHAQLSGDVPTQFWSRTTIHHYIHECTGAEPSHAVARGYYVLQLELLCLNGSSFDILQEITWISSFPITLA